MKNILLVIAFVVIVPLGLLCFGATVGVTVETKDISPGGEQYLRVMCTTDVALVGIRIPLKVGDNSDISLDSVSFEHTIAPAGVKLQTWITDVNRSAWVNFIPPISGFPLPTFTLPGGELCRIYFHAYSWAQPAFVPVDSFISYLGYGYYDQLNASDPDGLSSILPSFQPGGLWITNAATDVKDNGRLPDQLSLNQNFPNPFNPTTQITFSIARPGEVRIDVFDVAGRLVQTLLAERFSSGEHGVSWDSRHNPSGVYFYRLTTDQGVLTRKMLLIK